MRAWPQPGGRQPSPACMLCCSPAVHMCMDSRCGFVHRYCDCFASGDFCNNCNCNNCCNNLRHEIERFKAIKVGHLKNVLEMFAQ